MVGQSDDSDPNDSDPNDSDPNDSDPNDSDPNASDPNDSDPNDSDPNDSDPNGGRYVPSSALNFALRCERSAIANANGPCSRNSMIVTEPVGQSKR